MRWRAPTECENDDALLSVAERVARARSRDSAELSHPHRVDISAGAGIMRCDMHMRGD
jgi:hypothetical protein